MSQLCCPTGWWGQCNYKIMPFQNPFKIPMSKLLLLAPKDFRTFLRPGERGPGIRMTSGGWNGYLAKQAQTEEWRALFQYLLSGYLLCMIGVARFIWILIWKYEYQLLIKKKILFYYLYVKNLIFSSLFILSLICIAKTQLIDHVTWFLRCWQSDNLNTLSWVILPRSFLKWFFKTLHTLIYHLGLWPQHTYNGVNFQGLFVTKVSVLK